MKSLLRTALKSALGLDRLTVAKKPDGCTRSHLLKLAAVAVASVATTTAQADVLTGTSSILPGNLATSPTTDAQIHVGYYAPGNLTIDTNNNLNGYDKVETTYDGYNGDGGIGAIIGEGTYTIAVGGFTHTPAVGTVKVDGGNFWSAGSINLGAGGGIGNLNLSNGADVEAYGAHTYSSSGIYVGWDNNSQGNLNVDSSTVYSSDLNIAFGDSSTGTITISNGGYVDQHPNYTTDQNAFTDATRIGFGNNAVGTVTVTGGGSTLETSGLGVGDSQVGGSTTNKATLDIQDGGQVYVDVLGNGQGGGAYVGSAQGSQVTIGGYNSAIGINSELYLSPITDTTNSNYGHELNIGGYGAGTVTVQQGGVLSAYQGTIRIGADSNNPTHSDPGKLLVESGGTVYANNIMLNTNGTLSGAGTVNSNVTVNGGVVKPGDPVTLTINGDLTFTSGILDIQLAGPNDYDQVVVNGVANLLSGTIQFDFINGYVPSVGDALNFLTASTLNIGPGVNYLLNGLPQGSQFSVNNSTGGLSLAVSAVPLPPAAWLFASAMVGLVTIGRRRRGLAVNSTTRSAG